MMPSPTEISVPQLSRLIGVPDRPALIDIRIDEDFALDPPLIPGSRRHVFNQIEDWIDAYRTLKTIIICHKGKKLSQGVAALFRASGIESETLEGGFSAWAEAGQLLVKPDVITERDRQNRTLWVTKARPKIDRIACPWLIRRFIDPGARFLFVKESEVLQVSQKFNATPFDIEGCFWSHRGEKCSFDMMIDTFDLHSPALDHLARIIRGADTGRLELAPQSAGLLAASLGYSRMYRNDLEQLENAMGLYDALYRWCRDATGESHEGSSHRAGESL